MGFFRAIKAVDTERHSVVNKDIKDCRQTGIFLSIVFSRAKESYDRLRLCSTVLYDDLIHVLHEWRRHGGADLFRYL